MNQRASHFVLGSAGQPYGSIYTKDYVKKEAENGNNQPKQLIATNPFRSSSVNNSDKRVLSTTNKTMFPAWDGAEMARMDPNKLAELKGHHFKLGGYAPGQTLTTHKDHYNRKQGSGEAAKNQEESKAKMRAHYHDFKEQPFTNYKSTYSSEFVPKADDYMGRVKPESIANGVVFGNNNIPMVSTSAAAYTEKERQQTNSALKHTSTLVLGGKQEPMKTINQHYFDEKPILKNTLPQQTMKELRATHFNLGNASYSYQTQSANYRPLEAQKNASNASKSASGTWVDKNARMESSTTYRRELPQREITAFQRATGANQPSIVLGKHGNNYQTEFKSNYQNQPLAQNPRANANGELSKDNVIIGSDKGYYETEHKASYKKGIPQVTEARGPNRENNFEIGGSSRQAHITVYQDEYRKDQQNKSTLFHRDGF